MGSNQRGLVAFEFKKCENSAMKSDFQEISNEISISIVNKKEKSINNQFCVKVCVKVGDPFQKKTPFYARADLIYDLELQLSDNNVSTKPSIQIGPFLDRTISVLNPIIGLSTESVFGVAYKLPTVESFLNAGTSNSQSNTSENTDRS